MNNGDAIQTLAKKGVDVKTTAPLAKAGASSDEVLDLTRKGVDVKLAGELVTEDVPLEDIKYYANNGNDLEGVERAVDMDIKSKYIMLMFKAVNENKIGVGETVAGGNVYAVMNNYCSWQRQSDVDQKWKSEGFCQTIQALPLDSKIKR